MLPNGFKRTTFSISFLLITGPSLSYAQTSESNANLRLEEIIVTAQKRSESLKSVPISVAAVSGDKIEKAGIENIEDLTSYLPNIHFTQTGFSTQIRVRGIGSDNSQGFEQSVGLYIDGIYHGRAQLYRAPLMDLADAELLRGPQGTLLGKNSAAGALIFNTAKPTDAFEAYVNISQELEYTGTEINGVISGPVTDNLNARLAARSLDEDGFIENAFKNEDEPQVDEKAIRLSLDWQATSNLNYLLKLENSQYDTEGRAIEITHDESLIPNGPSFSQFAQSIGQPGFDSDLDFVRSTNTEEFSNNEINNLTLTTNYSFNDHVLTFTTGWLDFEYDELCDCDFLPIETIPLRLEETYEQFSQEIRITSPSGEKVEWIAGLFYQDYDQTFFDTLEIEQNNLLPTLLSFDPNLGNTAFAFVDTSSPRNFTQDSSAWALFGQATYRFTDHLKLTLGGRFTEEEKNASKVIDIVQPSTGALLNDNPLLGQLYWLVFGTETEALLGPNAGHNVQGSRNESKFLPLVNLIWTPTENTLAYIRYTEGFKAGGFDPRSNTVGPLVTSTEAVDPLESFEFENEDAKSYEIGFKKTLLDNRAEFNVALYLTDYENLQISQFDGSVGFNVGNAAETRTQGIEIDGRAVLTEHLRLSAGASFLDFEYQDFQNGNCAVGETPDGIDTTGDGLLNTCDYTGRRGVYTPEYTLNASLDYHNNLTNKIDILAVIDWQYVDSQNVHVNQDPLGEIDGYSLVGASVGLESDHWSARLRVSNLFDEEILSYSANAPLAETFGSNTQYSFVRAPRLVFIDLGWKF